MQFGSEYAHLGKTVSSKNDPFNFPMPNRSDLMSLSTIQKFDGMKTTTVKFNSGRSESLNLTTNDIHGKFRNNCSNDWIQEPSPNFTDRRPSMPISSNGTSQITILRDLFPGTCTLVSTKLKMLSDAKILKGLNHSASSSSPLGLHKTLSTQVTIFKALLISNQNPQNSLEINKI